MTGKAIVVKSTGGVVNTADHEAMRVAIAKCREVDQLKNYHDQALALEIYARQAHDTESERRATDIRLRAERRYGSITAELARATPEQSGAMAGGPSKSRSSNDGTTSPYAEALERSGVSRQTAHRWERLAQVPEDKFEAALAAPERPTTASLLKLAPKPKPERQGLFVEPIDQTMLLVWNTLREMERQNVFSSWSMETHLKNITEAMASDISRLAPLAADFFAALGEANENHQ